MPDFKDMPASSSPLEMYKDKFPEIAMPEKRPPNPDRNLAYFGTGFSRNDERVLAIAGITHKAMLGVFVGDVELNHIFTGTIRDADTIHELQRVIRLSVADAYLLGFEAGYDSREEAATQE